MYEHKTCKELIIDTQKLIHIDTGSAGNHLKLAQRVREAKSDQEASDILCDYERSRMAAIRESQRPKLTEVKRRLDNLSKV